MLASTKMQSVDVKARYHRDKVEDSSGGDFDGDKRDWFGLRTSTTMGSFTVTGQYEKSKFDDASAITKLDGKKYSFAVSKILFKYTMLSVGYQKNCGLLW